MKFYFTILLFFCFPNTYLFSQADSALSERPRNVFDIEKNSFLFPHVWKPGSIKAAVGLTSTKFPLDYVESALKIGRAHV